MRSLRASLALTSFWIAALGCGPPGPLTLVASHPAHLEVDVPTSIWIDLEFAGAPPASAKATLGLLCLSTGVLEAQVFELDPNRLAVNPNGQLPPDDACSVTWVGDQGWEYLSFFTAADGSETLLYDPRDPGRTAPVPDDFLLVDDLSTNTGLRVAMPIPDREADVQEIFDAVLNEVNGLDGWSPIAHMLLELSIAADPASVPTTSGHSLDPLASVALVDLDPASFGYGERVPIYVTPRDDVTATGHSARTLMIFPGIPLEPGGVYGLVVTRGVLAQSGAPFAPSEFFEAVLAPAQPGEDPEIAEVRGLVSDVFAVTENVTYPPIPREDVAFAARITVRTTETLPDDFLAIKRHLLATAAPAFSITTVEPHANPNIAAEVTGLWHPPDWRDGVNFERGDDGLPEQTAILAVPFKLALPAAALTGPVPAVMYQHGNPGQADNEVMFAARDGLAEGGYAVIGFTDILNREVAPVGTSEVRITLQTADVLSNLQTNRRLPDHWAQTRADQLAFVRMIGTLGALDVLPIGAPDGVPELDVSQPLLYQGISEGANNWQGLAPYAPEFGASAMVVGGARLAETLVWQQAATFLEFLPLLFPNMTPADIWVALALFQASFDRQDNHNHARFTYRDPLPVPLACASVEDCAAEDYCDTPGNCTTGKASVLVIEGIDDTRVPNTATASSAFQMGPIPHLAPVQRAVPFLDVVASPLSGNIDAETTAAFVQYVPIDVPGIPPTPSCEADNEEEGHFCPQDAIESLAQQLVFFGTALDPGETAPTIADMLPFYPPGTPLFPLPSP